MELWEVEEFKEYFTQKNERQWDLVPGATFIVRLNGEEYPIDGYEKGTLQEATSFFLRRVGGKEYSIPMRPSALISHSRAKPA